MSAMKTTLVLATVTIMAATAWFANPSAQAEPSTKPTTQPTSSPAGEAKWLTSYEEAAKQAKSSNKLILADFTGSDWCGWCIKLKAEVFNTKEFKEWAAKNVILLELDFPRKTPQDAATKKQNAELAKKYKIEGYPTILFLDSDGKQVGQSGYLKGGPAVWTAAADKIIAKKAK